jgi:hypothetical protein
MARRSLPSGFEHAAPPETLADVDIVLAESSGSASKVVPGADVAALLEVTANTERLLDPESISLELDHVADVLGALADGAEQPTAGALFLAEDCLRRLSARVDALRLGAETRAEQYRIVPRGSADAAQEELAPYRVVLALSDGLCNAAGIAPFQRTVNLH